MTKKTVFILFAVLIMTVFLGACHPGRWHKGCQTYGPVGSVESGLTYRAM